MHLAEVSLYCTAINKWVFKWCKTLFSAIETFLIFSMVSATCLKSNPCSWMACWVCSLSRSMQCGTHWNGCVITSARAQLATEFSFVEPWSCCQNLEKLSWIESWVHVEAIICLLYHMPDVIPMIHSTYIFSMPVGCCELTLCQFRQRAVCVKCSVTSSFQQHKRKKVHSTQTEIYSNSLPPTHQLFLFYEQKIKREGNQYFITRMQK